MNVSHNRSYYALTRLMVLRCSIGSLFSFILDFCGLAGFGLFNPLKNFITTARTLTGTSEITFYWASHTFANLARNKCHMDKDSTGH
ncbi:hypothetical protein J2W55_000679 [Mucilaginibacter pocheonensis]|uniref:Uncharacterized protein n=1 Tax=Mucilaginibacter pocheonensis TaxID=398050 RepID=A0ABU1T643_9SPHI|nr:hypothetical protein [Mucilaginibacter pocheonensis]